MPIPTFFDPRQCAPQTSFSPSSSKPCLAVQRWQTLKLDIEIKGFDPATEADLCLAHDPEYVRGVLTCKVPNGFSNTSSEVAASLPWTTGSMVAAALHVGEAAKRGEPAAACSPTSGFHHAHYSFAHGYCTFNGLVVAARKLVAAGLKPCILDCDFHFGDGTDQIIEHLALNEIEHWTAGLSYGRRHRAAAMLDAIDDALEKMARQGVKVVLYQAGADQHVDDPLGGLLGTTEMKARDAMVFDRCRQLGMNVAWNLAGGYQTPIEKVIKLHTNTMKECINVFC